MKSSRVITATIAIVSSALTIFGAWLFYSGARILATTQGQNLPEDNPHAFDGFIGLFQEFIGIGIMVVAGIVAIIFIVAYLRVSRNKQTSAYKSQGTATTIKPKKV